MIDLTEKQRQRSITDKRTFLINELNKLGVKVNENHSLSELEQIHINEKCRLSREKNNESN